MPLEPTTNDELIQDLNKDWPAPTDRRYQGDDHLRLVKRVLKNQFPSLEAPVTATASELNNGHNAIAQGAVMLFYSQNPPAGFERVQGLTTNFNVVLVDSGSTEGGTGAGTHNPLTLSAANLPRHTHSFTTSGESGHTHKIEGGTSASNPRHNHYVSLGGGHHTHGYLASGAQGAVGTATATNRPVYPQTLNVNGTSHTHAGYTNETDVNHAHFVNFTSRGSSGHTHNGTTNVTGGDDWVPRRVHVILCRKL